MAGGRRIDIERRKDICIKEWGVESRDNLVTLWCTSN